MSCTDMTPQRAPKVEWISGDDTYRPSLWLWYRTGRCCVVWLGWRKPSVVWL